MQFEPGAQQLRPTGGHHPAQVPARAVVNETEQRPGQVSHVGHIVPRVALLRGREVPQNVHQHHGPSRHREHAPDVDQPSREMQSVEHRDSHHGTRGALQAGAAGHAGNGRKHPNQSGHDDQSQVNAQEFDRSIDSLHIASEKPQRHHVPKNVEHVAVVVHEAVGQQLVYAPRMSQQVGGQVEPVLQQRFTRAVRTEQQFRQITADRHQNDVDDHRAAAQQSAHFVLAIVRSIVDAHEALARYTKRWDAARHRDSQHILAGSGKKVRARKSAARHGPP